METKQTNMKEETKKIDEHSITKASVDYANNYFEMHETNHFKGLKQGFQAGVKWLLKELESEQELNINNKTMETKQTAVEWLDSNLIHMPYTQKDFAHNVKVIEKAKVMHKEQIAEAFNSSYWFIDGQQYYEETYGK